jgi:hypothetical protein
MNASFDFLTDEPASAIHKLLKEFGLCLDRGFRGEINRLLELRGFRRAYLRKRHGLTVDAFAEIMWSRGITGRRLTCVETLDVLEMVLTPKAPRKSRRRAAEVLNEIEREAKRATENRQRKFSCPVCNQIARATRGGDLLCGRCFATDGAIVSMLRVSPFPEELLAQAAAVTP